MQELIDRLNGIDPVARQAELEAAAKTEKRPRELNAIVKELKILRNLNDLGMSPVDAFTRTTIPVIPSQFRAPIELPGGSMYNPDINVLTRNIGLVNDVVNEAKSKLSKPELESLKKDLYDQVEQLVAIDAPQDPKNEIRNNYFTTIAGVGSPKNGFFQSKMIRKRQNLSARGVIVPVPELDIDEVEIPYNMGFKSYEPFIKRQLRDRGYSSSEADDHIKKQTDLAKAVLQEIGNERPLIINRAPSIWAGSVTGHRPIFVDKETIGTPNLIDPFQKADHDGDSCLCNIHLRVFNVYSSTWLSRFCLTVFAVAILLSHIFMKGDNNEIRHYGKRKSGCV